MPSSHHAPLQGVKILDLTRLLPGPLCTQHLADLGAEVIKIEDTGAGDYAQPALRAAVNRNKRGIRLNLKTEAGRQALLALCEHADVLTEGFRPGVMERLGLGYDDICTRNPRIVYCSITGYGQTGPYRHLAGHDLNYCSSTGVSDQIGTADGVPALSNLPLADLMGGTQNAVMGILAALFDAARTGRGRMVDIAMSDGVMAHAVVPLAGLNDRGDVTPAGRDTLSGGLPCYGLYATADDRLMAVGALEPKFWERCCEVLGRPDLKEYSRPAQEHTAAIREQVAAAFRTRTQAQWTELFREADCCVSPVLTLAEAMADEQVRARDMVTTETTAEGRRVTHLGCPVKMSDFEFSIRRPAPSPGQHTDEILLELGYKAADIAELRAAGAAG